MSTARTLQTAACACGAPSVYSRRYSGESLCGACFAKSIEKKAANAVSRHSMIRRGDSVCVGVSGGKDSLALLQILAGLSERRGFEIVPVTIDEGIPGYRDEALSIVSDFCGSLGLEHRVLSYKELFGTTLEDALESRTTSTTSCSICGILRRRALDHAADELGSDSVATGHNLDDIVQTMLINLMSGDTERIAWMDPDIAPGTGVRRIKPLCDVYESEVAFYAFTTRIPFQAESCPHSTEGIRTEVREFLNSLESRHSGIKNNMYRSALAVAQAMHESAPKKESSPCAECGAPSTSHVCSACSTLARIGPGS